MFNYLTRDLKIGLNFLTILLKRKRRFFFLAIFLIITLGISINLYKKNFLRPTLVEGVVGTYTEEDLPEVVTNLLSESLVRVEKDGIFKPNLFSGWEVDKDSKVFVFKLRDNLSWVDGTKIKVSDIDIGLSDIERKNLDEKLIEIKLKDSFAPFPIFLTKPIFKLNSNGKKIGTGPYKVVKIIKDQIFVKKLTLISINKDLPDITVKFYPSERIARTAFKLGEVEALLGLNDLSDLVEQKTVGVFQKTNFSQLVTVFYNTKDPILSDENFRLALGYATPEILDESKAVTSIPPAFWAFNPDVKEHINNPEQAKVYFKKVENGRDSTITLTVTSSLKQVGERVVEGWKKVGIKANLRVESGIPQNFQSLLIAQNIPHDPDQYSLWHSTQTQTNISKLSDSKVSPRIDMDLEDGRKSADLEVRKSKYFDFQKVLLDHAPATFLYFPKYNIVYRLGVDSNLMKVVKIQVPFLNN